MADSRLYLTPAVGFSPSAAQHHNLAPRRTDGTKQHNDKTDGAMPVLVDEDVPENMYLPDKDDPEGWIHRDKLAKIESEELQAAGIKLADTRARSYGRPKSGREVLQDVGNASEFKQHQPPYEPDWEERGEDGDADRATWDIRTREEIEAEAQAVQQLYSNPVYRKSGSKIPVLTGSPVPVPIERYGRETPIVRKRGTSGTISLDDDRAGDKPGEDHDSPAPAVTTSSNGSPGKPKSATSTMGSPTHRKTASTSKKAAGPVRATPLPGARPALHPPEGDPPWLATMYKPDPMLPPDQQLIPTLAKKQKQAQWAAENAVPKTYNHDFEPVEVHESKEMPPSSTRSRTPSPVKATPPAVPKEGRRPPRLELPALGAIHSAQSNNSRPGTAGSMTGGYSTMPKVTSPAIRDGGFSSAMPSPALQRPVNMAPPPRMQAQNLMVEDGEKAKKGCSCCVVM